MLIYERARIFATAAHAAVGQTRKYTGDPYVVHPAAVVELVWAFHPPEGRYEAVAAAWLHDVVEDTSVTLTLIHREFGPEVGDLVGWLTDVSRPQDGNRANRKALDRAHSAAAPASAQTVKVCDMIDNARSIVRHDPDFARVFMREKRALLDALVLAAPEVRALAEDLLRAYDESLLQGV